MQIRSALRSPTIAVTPGLTDQERYNAFEDDSQFVRGFKSGVSGISQGSFAKEALDQELAANALREAGAPGVAEADAKWQANRDIALRMQQDAAAKGPRVTSLRDINGVGDAVDFGLGAVGQGVASMTPVVAAALATRGRSLLASSGSAALAGYGMERNEAIARQYADPTLAATNAQDRSNAAVAKGAVNAALESIVPVGLAGTVLRRPVTSALGTAAKNVVEEGTTELLQEGVGYGAEKYLDPNRKLDPMNLADAFVAGGLTGGVMSGGASAAAYAAQAAGKKLNTPGVAAPAEPAAPAAPAEDTRGKTDRFLDALSTTGNPLTALRSAFTTLADSAAEDLVPDDQNHDVLNAEDPGAAILQRDTDRTARATQHAAELMKDPDTPPAMKERVASMDLTVRENRDTVNNVLVAQNAGKVFMNAVLDLSDMAKVSFGKLFAGKAAPKANLQNFPDEPMAPLVNLIAQRLGPQAVEAPKIARQLLAATSMFSGGDPITPAVAARLTNLSTVVDKDMLDMVSSITGNDALKSTLAKIQAIPSATTDLGKNSFFESLLKVPLSDRDKRNLAEVVDEAGLKLTGANSTVKENMLKGLANYFGDPKTARTVVEYYGARRRAAFKAEAEANTLPEDRPQAQEDMRYVEDTTQTPTAELDKETASDFGVLTEKDAPPLPSYKFRDAKSLRPYRAFAKRGVSADGMRMRSKESTLAGIELRKGSPDSARVRPVKYSQYVEDTGKNPETELRRITDDISKRIAENTKRKDEDRSTQTAELQGELDLIQHTYLQKGVGPALDLYEVLQVNQAEKNDLVADDNTVAKYGELLGKTRDSKGDARIAEENKAIRDTAITFVKADGKKIALSAESMWKSQGDKEGSGKGEPGPKRVKRLFAEAVASMLARPDIAGIVGAKGKNMPPNLLIDRASGARTPGEMTAEKKLYMKERRAAVDAERARRETIKKNAPSERRAGLQKRLDEFEETLNDAKSNTNGAEVAEQLDAMIEPLRVAAATATKRASDAMDAYKAAKQNDAPKAEVSRLLAIADVEREAAQDFRNTIEDMEGLKFEDALERSDNEEIGPIGPNGALRTTMNEQDGSAGKTRLYEEDTGLGIGKEKRSAATPNAPKALTASEAAAIRVEMVRTRGPQIKVAFKKFLAGGASGQYTLSDDRLDRLIEVSIHAGNPMGVARHEALHDFFATLSEDAAGRSIKKDLIDAANAPHVKTKLRELLKGHPEALKQIESNAEERVAYMYQFHIEGLLPLGPIGTGIFARLQQFFRDVFKLVSAEERAKDLLTALDAGKFRDLDVVKEVLADMPADRLVNKIDRVAPVINDTLRKLFSAAPDRLRAFQNEKINEIAELFSSESGKLGFIQRRFQQEGTWTNKLGKILEGSTAVQRREALNNLQAMKDPSTPLEVKLTGLLEDLQKYLSTAGVLSKTDDGQQFVPFRNVKNYFPRNFDRTAILEDRDGFAALLQKHGNLTVAQAEATIKQLTHGTGQDDLVENEHSLGYTPFASATNARKLTFINKTNAAEFAKYQSKDLADTLTGYIKQAAHRAEYARTFGNDGSKIQELIKKSGITKPSELAEIARTVQGLEGSLANDMSSSTKELMSSVMTLQNLVILPMAIFSQMMDPVVLAARSGDLRDAGNAYVTAMKRLVGKEVDGEELADILGITSQDSVLEAMGMAHGVSQMSGDMRNLNRMFFKYNGLQGWNNSMRIAATAAGEKFLIANHNNEAALEELGLAPKDIVIKADGNLDVSSPAVQQAMFRFVDQAVIRPSASNRPVWMSDPRFLLIAHLKQFTFAMHNVVLKRAGAQLENGNVRPWATLLLAMPVMFASDMGKALLRGDAHMAGWGFFDYMKNTIERSGLLGIGDFSTQATRGVEAGKMPGEALLGPTMEHLLTILRWIGGDARTDFKDVVDRTVPGAKFL
jgi:hypothetical protein